MLRFSRSQVPRAQLNNQMCYRDVTHVDFKTKRSTNPLNPTYVHRDEEKKLVEIGAVQGSIPCVLPKPREDPNFQAKSLKTDDIHGCKIGTRGLGNFHNRERREIKETNRTEDIFGAKPGSLKKGPTTTRSLHPLMPDYQMPGRNELTNMNDAFGKRNAVQQAILDRHAARNDGGSLK